LTLRLEAIDLLAGAAARVLDHASLAVSAGEIVVLGGGRGAGKSSLLAIAAGVLRPEAGAVFLGDRDLAALQSSSLPYVRRNIGYLPAEAPLIRHETVLENVRVALLARGLDDAAATTAAQAALAAVALEPLAARAVATLSSPERRLTALARALVGPPPLLVLDEPTGGLDAEDRGLVVEALADAADAGAAVLCGTGDDVLAAELAERGARVLTLMDGRVIGGTPIIGVLDGNGWLPRPVPEARAAEARPARRRRRADGGTWT
jgi:ABC-type lipoprotein export system ATPase subunit